MWATGFVIVGGMLLAVGLHQQMKTAASRSWPSTTGTVVSAEVRSTPVSRSAPADAVAYMPVFRYEFDVNGMRFTGDRQSFGRMSYATPQEAELHLDGFPQGKQVDVFYNPAKPEDCVIERENSVITWLLIGVGAGMVFTGIMLTVR
jgi:hypothetical protein